MHLWRCQHNTAINMSNENSCRCNCFASRLKSSVKCRAWGANFPFCCYRAPPGDWARTAKGIFSVTVSVSWLCIPTHKSISVCQHLSIWHTQHMGATFCNYISPKLKVNNRHFSYKLLDGEIKCLYTVRLQRHWRHPWMMLHHHQSSVLASNWGNSGARAWLWALEMILTKGIVPRMKYYRHNIASNKET